MTSSQPNRNDRADIIRTLAQSGQQQPNMPPHMALTTSARKALEASGEGWDPELDLKIHLVEGRRPISLHHTSFKSIDIRITMVTLLERCNSFTQPPDMKNTVAIAEQMVYSMVRLWVGHYNHCPYDSWRHQFLCRAAAKGGFGTTAILPEQRALAEAVTAFFERSVVARIISNEEGDFFAKGIVYEYFVNNRQPNLLTNLFFLSQLLAAPKVWQAVLRDFSMPRGPLAEALSPDVLKLLFGLRIFRDGQSVKTIPDRPNRYSSWTDRVYRLAELLIPYLCENNQRPDSEPNQLSGQNGLDNDIGGQSPNIPGISSQLLEQMGNPFVSADENSQNLQATVQSGGLLPGRSSSPPPRYNLEELDRYYSQRATGVVVETQDSTKDKTKQPENLQVGFLDSEEAPLSALVSGQTDWFRMRCITMDGRNQLRLYKRTDPLEIPLDGDEPGATGSPHLLLLVDSSGSMKFNPTGRSSGNRGKYDLVLLSCYGIFKYIEDKKLGDNIQVACINFSGRSIESGWHPFNSVEKVKGVLLTYQGGGTTLSPLAVHRAFQSRPGNFLAITITDGGLGNTTEAVSELRKVVESDCDLVLLHVGQTNAFTKAVEEMNCPVHMVNSANDLVGLSLQIARKRFS